MLVIVPSNKVFQHCEFYCLVKTNGIHVLNRTSTQRNFHSYFDLHECHYNGEDDDVGLLGASQYGEMPGIAHIHRTPDFFIYNYFLRKYPLHTSQIISNTRKQ
jgi:hypothetical protein